MSNGKSCVIPMTITCSLQRSLARADLIVTGDDNLLTLKTYQNIPTISRRTDDAQRM